MKSILFTLLIFSFSLNSQIIEGYDLSKYPAKVSTLTKKAKLNFNSNPSAIAHKVKIVELYDKQSVSFAGNYVTILIECGTDCVKGFMVDIRSGTIYTMPISKLTVCNSCVIASDVFDRYLFSPESKLLVTSICREKLVENKTKVKQNQSYSFYLWNEGLKKFDLLKKTNTERTVVR